MAAPYLVTGNNLFKQWLSNESVLESFENWSKILSRVSCKFDIKEANLINICWSYNVFKNKDGYCSTGVWGDNENMVTKLDIFDKTLDTSDLIITCNDFKLYLVDAKLLKIWEYKVGEIFTCTPLDLSFEFKLEIPQNLKISKVVSSNNSITFLTNSGHVFCGIPPIHIDTSHCVGEVCDIVCGYNHFILLTTIGHVYTWGCGERLQLGHSDITSKDIPTAVDALSGLKITKVAAGGVHSLALSEFGDVYAWGWNQDGQLGVNLEHGTTNSAEMTTALKCLSIPSVVDIFDEHGKLVELNVVDIACGSKHSVIKLEDNSVWATGCNKYGQLGISRQDCPSAKYFRKVLQCDIGFELMCGTWNTVILKK